MKGVKGSGPGAKPTGIATTGTNRDIQFLRLGTMQRVENNVYVTCTIQEWDKLIEHLENPGKPIRVVFEAAQSLTGAKTRAAGSY